MHPLLVVSRANISDNLKRVLYPVLWNYLICMVFSVVSAIICLCIAYALSTIQYKVANPTETRYFALSAFTKLVVLFNVFGLLFFTVFQFVVFNGRQISTPKYLVLAIITLCIFIALPLILDHYNIPYHYYMVDVLLIVVLFCGLCFMIGYFGKEVTLDGRHFGLLRFGMRTRSFYRGRSGSKILNNGPPLEQSTLNPSFTPAVALDFAGKDMEATLKSSVTISAARTYYEDTSPLPSNSLNDIPLSELTTSEPEHSQISSPTTIPPLSPDLTASTAPSSEVSPLPTPQSSPPSVPALASQSNIIAAPSPVLLCPPSPPPATPSPPSTPSHSPPSSPSPFSPSPSSSAPHTPSKPENILSTSIPVTPSPSDPNIPVLQSLSTSSVPLSLSSSYDVDEASLDALERTKSLPYKYLWRKSMVLSKSQRVFSGFSFMMTEVAVSVSALFYGMFLLTYYTSLDDTMKVVWRLLVHPAYFEVFMMLPVRYLVSRKMKLADCNVLYALSVVHAQSHTSTIGRMMFSSFDSVESITTSILLLNVGKFFFRLTSPVRDNIVQKLISSEDETEHQKTQLRKRYIVAIGIQTEIIMENSCAIFAGATMWFFRENKDLFMFPYPKGAIQLNTVIYISLVQIGFAIVFDLLTLFIGQKYLQLPILEAWYSMWRNKYRFFGFLLYGLVTMGLIGVFYMGLRVTRVMFCSQQSVCDCVWINWMPMYAPNYCSNFLASL